MTARTLPCAALALVLSIGQASAGDAVRHHPR